MSTGPEVKVHSAPSDSESDEIVGITFSILPLFDGYIPPYLIQAIPPGNPTPSVILFQAFFVGGISPKLKFLYEHIDTKSRRLAHYS